MGVVSTEQTVAIIDAVGDVIESSQPIVQESHEWLIPLIVTIIGGVVTTIFGVWYTKRKKNK